MHNPRDVHSRDCWDGRKPAERRNDEQHARQTVSAALLSLQIMAGCSEQRFDVDITPDSILPHGIQSFLPFSQIHSYSSNDIAMNRNDIVMSWYIFNRYAQFNFIMELIQKMGEAENPL